MVQNMTNQSHLKTKIKRSHDVVVCRTLLDSETKALLPWDSYNADTELSVLGVPYGGPEMGRDSEGDAFHAETNIAMNIGDSVVVTYYHGFGPDDPFTFQDPPQFIGRAVLREHDEEKGYWFDVRLDETNELAQRVLAALGEGEDVKSSSGAAGHLVRMRSNGLIDTWPVAELAVFDTNEDRQPANQFAVVEKKSLTVVEPETEAKTAEAVKADVEQSDDNSDDIPVVNNVQDQQDQETIDVLGDVKMTEPENAQVEGTQDQENVIEVVTPEIDYEAMAKALMPMVGDAVKSQVVEAVSNLDIDTQIKSVVTEIANEPPTQTGVIAVPAVKRVTKTGFSDDENETFRHYLKTGDKVAAKAALQEGTDAEGGFLVPNDFYGPIVEKRDEMSIPRIAGSDLFNTSLQVVDIPVEDTAMTDFVLTAEEAGYDQNEPTFANRATTVYKYTKMLKVSEELIADEKSNLMQFISNGIGRAMATTENNFFAVGTGSSQPQGVTVGGTAAVTAAGAAAITAGEVEDLYTALGEYLEDDSFWMMAKETFALIRKLQGDPFLFQATPQGNGIQLKGHRVFVTTKMPAATTGLKSVVFGNGQFYTLVESEGLTVRRLDELYAANGQVGLQFKFRVGGIVTQAQGFQYLTQA